MGEKIFLGLKNIIGPIFKIIFHICSDVDQIIAISAPVPGHFRYSFYYQPMGDNNYYRPRTWADNDYYRPRTWADNDVNTVIMYIAALQNVNNVLDISPVKRE